MTSTPLRAALLAALLLSTAAQARVYRVGPGRTHTQLSQVAGLLEPGDVAEVDGNATYSGVSKHYLVEDLVISNATPRSTSPPTSRRIPTRCCGSRRAGSTTTIRATRSRAAPRP